MHIRSDHVGRLSFIWLYILLCCKARELNSIFWADSKALTPYLHEDNLRINVIKLSKSHSNLN